MQRVRTVARALRGGVRQALTPSSMRGAAVECAWVATHVALYPLGVVRERARAATWPLSLHELPPAHRGLYVRDVEAAGTPILLVHGMVDNRSIFTLLRRHLRRRGFGRVSSHNYSPLTTDVRAAAARLAERVDDVCAESGYDRIHVVGHSLGGLVARYYVQRLGGDARVHTLVTLGTPHGGTHAARLLPHALLRQIRPGSALLRELDAPAAGCRTRFIAYWSDVDPLMLPPRAARIEHPDLSVANVLVPGVGHMSLPISGRVVRGISTALAHLAEDGATVTPGVTPLAERGSPRAVGGDVDGPAGAQAAAQPTQS